MTLEPFFSLNPLNPLAYTYDPANVDASYAFGIQYSFGGITLSSSPYGLADQYNNNELILGRDPVIPTEQSISSTDFDIRRRCAIQFYFWGRNVSTENQYLLLFSIRSISGLPIAQFFVGDEFVRSEEISEDEQVAILLDVPGDGTSVYVYLRLASEPYFTSSALAFQGMECYLL